MNGSLWIVFIETLLYSAVVNEFISKFWLISIWFSVCLKFFLIKINAHLKWRQKTYINFQSYVLNTIISASERWTCARFSWVRVKVQVVLGIVCNHFHLDPTGIRSDLSCLQKWSQMRLDAEDCNSEEALPRWFWWKVHPAPWPLWYSQQVNWFFVWFLFLFLFPTPPPWTGIDTRSIFTGVWLISVKCFPSSWLVALPRL